jgi:hypothetical protein
MTEITGQTGCAATVHPITIEYLLRSKSILTAKSDQVAQQPFKYNK